MRRKFELLKIVLRNLFIQFFLLTIILGFIIIILVDIYNVNLISIFRDSLSAEFKSNIIKSLLVFFFIYVFFKVNELSKNNFLEDLSKEENKIVYVEKLIIESQINLNTKKETLDILKFISPLPFITLFLGNYIKEDFTIGLNTYSIVVTLMILFYFWLLISTYQNYKKISKNMISYKTTLVDLKSDKNPNEDANQVTARLISNSYFKNLQ